MNDLERALSQISEVRSQMAAATRFRGLAPHAVGLSAIGAVAGALLQTGARGRFNADARTFVEYWAAIAAMSAIVIAIEAFGRAHQAHGARASNLLDSALRLLLPACAAGAAITFILWRTAPDVLWLMPGLWQVLVALAGFSALPMLSPEMRWAGFFYLASGMVCLLLARGQNPMSPWLMGVPFGLGQTMVAVILYRANETSRG